MKQGEKRQEVIVRLGLHMRSTVSRTGSYLTPKPRTITKGKDY